MDRKLYSCTSHKDFIAVLEYVRENKHMFRDYVFVEELLEDDAVYRQIIDAIKFEREHKQKKSRYGFMQYKFE